MINSFCSKFYLYKKNFIMTTKDNKKQVALVKLEATELAKIENVFSEARDFREV